MSNKPEKQTQYFRIKNGKALPKTDQAILVGDDLIGKSSTDISPALVLEGTRAVAEIQTCMPQVHIRDDLEKFPSIDPESLVPRRGWMLRTPMAVEAKPKWKKISVCGKSDKLDLDFILPGLPRKSVGTLVSPGGTGKSMTILQTAAHCVLGREAFLNQSLKKRQVCYLSLEDPDEVLHNRLHDLYHKLDPKASESDRLDENLLAASLTLSVAIDKSDPNPDAILRLFELGQEPDLIIVDTARRAHQLDENSAGEMSIFIAILEEVARELNCAVLMLHHTSKGATFAKSQGVDHGAGVARGSSVLVDNVRTMFAMHVMPQKVAKQLGVSEEDRKQYIQLTHEKCNYQKALHPVWLKRDETGLFDAVDFSDEENDEEDYERTNLFK